MKPESASRPRIWAVGISRLRALFMDVDSEYVDRAELDVIASVMKTPSRASSPEASSGPMSLWAVDRTARI